MSAAELLPNKHLLLLCFYLFLIVPVFLYSVS